MKKQNKKSLAPKLKLVCAVIVVSIFAVVGGKIITSKASPVIIGARVYGPLPYTVDPAHPGQWTLSFGTTVSSTSRICVYTYFEDNLLDPGEQLRVQVPGGTAGQLITNKGVEPVNYGSVCFNEKADVTLFKNGSYPVRISSELGSVKINSVNGYIYPYDIQ